MRFCEGKPLVKGDTLIERTTQTVIKSRSPQSGDMAFNKSFCAAFFKKRVLPFTKRVSPYRTSLEAVEGAAESAETMEHIMRCL